jgi:hypothetical protein
MENLEMFKEDIQDRMKRLDERVALEFEGDGYFQIIIVGGGALVLRGYVTRATSDIDVLDADRRLLSLMELYDMNGDVNAYIDHFPYNYEDRIEFVYEGQKIKYCTASLEDIVIAKLCSNRGDDLTDVELVIDKINWELLEKLALDENEIKASIMCDRRYNDFVINYESIVRRFRP